MDSLIELLTNEMERRLRERKWKEKLNLKKERKAHDTHYQQKKNKKSMKSAKTNVSMQKKIYIYFLVKKYVWFRF